MGFERRSALSRFGEARVGAQTKLFDEKVLVAGKIPISYAIFINDPKQSDCSLCVWDLNDGAMFFQQKKQASRCLATKRERGSTELSRANVTVSSDG